MLRSKSIPKVKSRRGRSAREQIGYWPIEKIIAWVERYEQEGKLGDPFDTRNVKHSEHSAARMVARRLVTMHPNLSRWNAREGRPETEEETVERVKKDVRNMLARAAREGIRSLALPPRDRKSFIAVRSYLLSLTKPQRAVRASSRRVAKR